MNDEVVFENLLYLQMISMSSVLALNCMGHYRIFVLNDFKGKSRDVFKNEMSGKDVTRICLKPDFKFKNRDELAPLIESLPVVSLEFGHDDFILLHRISQNESRTL